MCSNEILVSVIVLTYNHEKYIKQALDSILMQKVDFRYEIIVGEDCSFDKTRDILKWYEKQYPEKFIMIYREKNIGGKKNLLDVLSRTRGKYLASLEGDDFWLDENKLQKQIDFLEQNPEVIATSHKVSVVDKYGNKIVGMNYPSCKDSWYTLKHFKNGILPGQTASIVRKNFYKYKLFDLSILDRISRHMPGDRISFFLLVSHGKFFCFKEVMSAYRYVTDNGTSFSATQKKHKFVNPLTMIDYYASITSHAHTYIKNKKAVETIECMYLWQAVVGCLKRYGGVSIKTVKIAWSEIRNKKAASAFVITNIMKLPFKFYSKKRMR